MFTGKLFDIQKPVAAKLCNKKRVLLAWEQGTGKTVIALAAAEKLIGLDLATRVLVIGRPSDYWQWGDKIEEFTDSSYTLVERTNRESRRYEGRTTYTLVPWSLFRRDYDTLSQTKWDLVIADEAQEFRNFNTKTAKLIKRLNVACNPEYRWALTGTAIGNKLEEIYSIMYWIEAGFLPPWPIFEERHIVRNELGLVYKYKNLKVLNEYLQERMDRKTHDDLKGQMPTLVRQTHKIPATPAYRKSEADLLAILEKMAADLHFDDEGNLKTAPNSKVSKSFHKVREELHKGKLRYAEELLYDLLRENPSNKAVLFCHNKQPLYDLNEYFGKLSVLYTGDQSLSEKRDAIRRFAESAAEGPRILLASDAGKAGLDLPFANYAIHLDIPFSWEVLDQRTKRITRASSDFRSVVAIHLIMEDSVEEFYYVIVTNKGRLASAVKEGTEDEVVMRPSSLRQYIKGDDDVAGGKHSTVSKPKKARAGSTKAPKRAQGKNHKRDLPKRSGRGAGVESRNNSRRKAR